jgi:hypothetical protein
VLVLEPFEDPLRRVLLLLRLPLIVSQDLVDDRDMSPELRSNRRLLAPIAWRHREPHHLVHGLGINPEPTGRCSLAQSFDLNGVSNLRV